MENTNLMSRRTVFFKIVLYVSNVCTIWTSKIFLASVQEHVNLQKTKTFKTRRTVGTTLLSSNSSIETACFSLNYTLSFSCVFMKKLSNSA
jgi:hypothetical protein